MSEILAKSVKILLATLLLCCSFNTLGQELEGVPDIGDLETSGACSNNNQDYTATFRIKSGVPPFNNGNVFHLELSDENGNFPATPNATRFVSTVENQNASYNTDIPASFQVPAGTYGDSFRVRIVSTDPEIIGQPSATFEAYDMYANGELFINDNADNAVICGNGNSAQLTLNTTITANYQWLKDGNVYATTTEPTITVTEAGNYRAQVDYGVCGFVDSRVIPVIVVNSANAEIVGENVVEICADETHTFEAAENNSAYTYNWYKDGSLVASSNSHTYTTPNTGQFGEYYLEILIEDCRFESQRVELRQKSTASFTITNNITEPTVILPGETIELEITIEPASSSVNIIWFRNGVQIPGTFTDTVNATLDGEYYAVVTETGGTCNFSQESERFNLIELKELDAQIRTASDYVECESTSTNLILVGVTAIGTDDNQYPLSDARLDNLNYQWYRDNTAMPGVVGRELPIADYRENDPYRLMVTVGAFEDNSNTIDVKLTIEDPEITSTSTSNSLCPGGSITFTVSQIVSDFRYAWLKDDVEITVADPQNLEVTETGIYKLQIIGAGCVKELDPIEIIPFDDSAVVVTPSEVVVLLSGQPTIITASGAESYEWYEDESGDLLSTNETVEVTEIGFYTVVATVGDCQVNKRVEVVEEDSQIIVPNIVSPRTQDGINDTWRISNRYSFQPTVTVSIYDSNGREVLTTNEYKNDWPSEDLGNQRIFYYKIIRDDQLIKAGSISIID
ncbi:Ig-like domain-containing protein [Tenacibaculum xiamenense]|uniref:Ig-like domain-containing protein n=1 Tax=Tenacibaculum xiamenense TaxID=1261553 RepID=UPI003893B051